MYSVLNTLLHIKYITSYTFVAKKPMKDRFICCFWCVILYTYLKISETDMVQELRFNFNRKQYLSCWGDFVSLHEEDK